MIRKRSAWGPAVFALSLAGALAGCNSAPPTVYAVAPRDHAGPSRPRLASLPPGAHCTAVIDEWQRQIDQDSKIGLLDMSVYREIEGEMQPAVRACDAGHGAQAVSLVRASRKRHGYPVD